MKKSFVVIGLGRFGLAIVKTLSSLKCDVLAIDVCEERVSKAAAFVSHCVICDSSKREALKDLGVGNFDHAIVAIGNCLQSTVLTTINLSELGIKNITVRADDEDHMKIMERLGATGVIIPEVESAKSLANQIVRDSVLDYHDMGDSHGIVSIKVPAHFREKSLIELDARNRFEINIIGISKGGEFFIPKGTDAIKAGDIITVIGAHNRLSKFDQFITLGK